MTVRQHLVRAALFLLVFLSPVGAPVIGFFLGSLCPADRTFDPTGPFAIDFASCGISPPIERLYQQAVFLPVLPTLWTGPVIGIPVAIAWVAAALWCAWTSVKHLISALRLQDGEPV